MSSSQEVRQLIIEYWFRIILCTSFSVDDIAKIMIEFGNEYEQFDTIVSATGIEETTTEFGKDDLTAKFVGDTESAFGLLEAIPGCIYHWQIKLLELSGQSVNIGIVEADKIQYQNAAYFWGYEYGYSYYQDGQTWHNNKRKSYGDSFSKDDIIHIWLDLKDNYDLSFDKNGKKYGKAWDVNQDTTYKLAVRVVRGSVEIFFFEIV